MTADETRRLKRIRSRIMRAQLAAANALLERAETVAMAVLKGTSRPEVSAPRRC